MSTNSLEETPARTTPSVSSSAPLPELLLTFPQLVFSLEPAEILEYHTGLRLTRTYCLEVSAGAAETNSDLNISDQNIMHLRTKTIVLFQYSALSLPARPLGLWAFLKVFRMFYLCSRPTNCHAAQCDTHTCTHTLDLQWASASSWEQNASGISNRKKRMTQSQRRGEAASHEMSHEMWA